MPAPDPSFSPGTNFQFNWSANSLSLAKTCPRKYYLSKVLGFQLKGKNPHLAFGIFYTNALERYDIARAEGKTFEEAEIEAVFLALKQSFGWESDHKFKNRDVLIRSVVWYLETYRNDVAHTVILSNGKPAVELEFCFDPGIKVLGSSMLFSGRIDKLVEFGELNYVMDHKTTGSTLGSYYFNQYELDIQVSLYSLSSRIVYDTPVQGVLIDAVQTAVGFSAFSRGIVMRSDSQLEEFLLDASLTIELMHRYAEAKYWPMNETACNNYGGCAFKGVCSKSKEVRQKFLETDFEQRVFEERIAA